MLPLATWSCCAPLERPELVDDWAQSDADDLPPAADVLEPEAWGLVEADFGALGPNETPESCRSRRG